MQRYRVFGYNNREGSQHTEALIAAYRTPEAAVAYARTDVMATVVIDWETDEILWDICDVGHK
jgi:hypothetical protein